MRYHYIVGTQQTALYTVACRNTLWWSDVWLECLCCRRTGRSVKARKAWIVALWMLSGSCELLVHGRALSSVCHVSLWRDGWMTIRSHACRRPVIHLLRRYHYVRLTGSVTLIRLDASTNKYEEVDKSANSDQRHAHTLAGEEGLRQKRREGQQSPKCGYNEALGYYRILILVAIVVAVTARRSITTRQILLAIPYLIRGRKIGHD